MSLDRVCDVAEDGHGAKLSLFAMLERPGQCALGMLDQLINRTGRVGL